MKPVKKLPYLKTVQTYNVDALTEDGELYTAEKRTQIVVEDDKGFMLMCNYMFGMINGLESIVDIKVMNWINENLQFNENIVTLNKYWKEKIQAHTGYSIAAIDRSIGTLAKKGYLVKDITCKRCAIYNVNPTYIWHGDREKRSGMLKWVLELQQFNRMPDKERQREEDIKRAAEYSRRGNAPDQETADNMQDDLTNEEVEIYMDEENGELRTKG